MLRLFLTVLLACAARFASADENIVIVTPDKLDNSCVSIDSEGRRTQSMSCLTEKLLPAGNAGGRQPPTLSGAEANMQRPSNQLGLYNRAALEHRMGNALGKSVVPQRPNVPPPASPLLPPR